MGQPLPQAQRAQSPHHQGNRGLPDAAAPQGFRCQVNPFQVDGQGPRRQCPEWHGDTHRRGLELMSTRTLGDPPGLHLVGAHGLMGRRLYAPGPGPLPTPRHSTASAWEDSWARGSQLLLHLEKLWVPSSRTCRLLQKPPRGYGLKHSPLGSCCAAWKSGPSTVRPELAGAGAERPDAVPGLPTGEASKLGRRAKEFAQGHSPPPHGAHAGTPICRQVPLWRHFRAQTSQERGLGSAGLWATFCMSLTLGCGPSAGWERAPI